MKRVISAALVLVLAACCLSSCYEEKVVPTSASSDFDRIQYADNGNPKIVYWAESGERYHIKPTCHTLRNGYISGSLELAKAAGRNGWCGICSKNWTDQEFEEKGNPYADDE